eukprot:TRINITY_DN835_c1_g1_i1.p1 TRINITY_DN835_c1_g1~~TRINITY_DN835_c1_g1_i1.p1  ORF type:complete len:773 (-),score=204.32 TRINITY_DN835_c1_g1_i1:2823-5141(-)
MSGSFNPEAISADKEKWVEIQKKTFTRWINTYLRQRDMRVEELSTDLADGLNLHALLELISEKKLPTINKRPRMRAHKLENCTKCVEFLQEQGLKLVGIASPDIVDCNLKLILGLIWTIILRYQIQKNREDEQKNALLKWVQSKIPERNVQDFTRSWADGMSVCALIEALRPGTLDISQQDPSRALENATVGIDTAEKEMEIPKVFMPEDMVSASDPLSCMTYISYYRDYDDRMNRMRNDEAHRRQMELLERTADPTKCSASGEGLNGGEVNIPTGFTIIARNVNNRQCPCGGANFVVTVTAPDGSQLPESDIKVDDKGDGTYPVTYTPRKAGPNKVAITLNGVNTIKSPHTVPISPPMPDPSKCRAFGPGVDGCTAGAPTNFTIQARNRIDEPITAGGHPFKTEVRGPFGEDIPAETKDNGDGTYTVSYDPAPGIDVVSVSLNGKPVANSPYKVEVLADPFVACSAQSYAFGPGVEGPCNTFDSCVFTIQAVRPDGEKMTTGADVFSVDVYSPDDDELPKTTVVDNNDGTYTATYHAPTPGKHRVEVILHNRRVPLFFTHIKDSPFSVGVAPGVDPSKCTASGPGLGNDVYDTKPTSFTVQAKDCLGNDIKSGGIPFKAEVIGPDDKPVPANVTDKGDGTYEVAYEPKTKGDHTVKVSLQDKPVAASPYTIRVKPGMDFNNTCIESFSFVIEARNKKGERHTKSGDAFEVTLKQEQGNTSSPVKQPKVTDHGDGTYGVTYALPDSAKGASYVLNASLRGRDIKHSPWAQAF